MTTKGHSLKEPSIRLFLNNRHKKPPRRIKKSSGHIFSKITGPIYGLGKSVERHLQYPVRVQSGFRHLPQSGFSTHGFDGSPLKENSQKQLS